MKLLNESSYQIPIPLPGGTGGSVKADLSCFDR